MGNQGNPMAGQGMGMNQMGMAGGQMNPGNPMGGPNQSVLANKLMRPNMNMNAQQPTDQMVMRQQMVRVRNKFSFSRVDSKYVLF